MNRFLYILFGSLFLINCTSNTIIKKPDNLIPKEEMVNLLTDMLLASGGQHIKNTEQQRDVNYFPLIFEKYHIDSTRFKESNFYYTSRIDDYEDILNQVAARLTKIKSEIDSERVIQDSIKRVQNPNERLDDYEE
jgi:hypothetical protein